MPDQTEQLGGPLNSLVTNTGNSVQLLGKLIEVLSTVLPFGGAFGTFTCGAAASTTVPNPSVAANSVIVLMPTNAAAGTLQGSTKCLYTSARTAGTSFVVTTSSGVAAAGTETFAYVCINPSA